MNSNSQVLVINIDSPVVGLHCYDLGSVSVGIVDLTVIRIAVERHVMSLTDFSPMEATEKKWT